MKNQEEKQEIEIKPKHIKKIVSSAITPKLRYEIALRYGKYIKRKDEKIDILGIRNIPEDMTETINDEDIKQIKLEIEDVDKETCISHAEAKGFISRINANLLNAGFSAGKEIDNYLENLAILNKYMHDKISIKNKNVGIRNKDEFIKKANDIIVSKGIIRGNKLLNSDYFIRFLDTIYGKFGEDIDGDTMIKLINQISTSNENEELLKYVEEIEKKFPRIQLEEVYKIMNILYSKVIPEKFKDININNFEQNKKTTDILENNGKRNLKLIMIKDITDSIEFDYKNQSEFIDVLKNLSNLSDQKLQEYWINYSGEMSEYRQTKERINNYLKVQKLQKEGKEEFNIRTMKKAVKNALKRTKYDEER